MKLLNIIKCALLLVALQTPHISFAGADIGGGTLNEFGIRYPTTTSSEEYYCEYTYDTLDVAIMKSYTASVYNLAEARRILRRGIQSSIEGFAKWGRDYKPLTRDALTRALELDRIFNNSCGSTSDICQEDRRALRFLFGYLQHVKENIVPLDSRYYIPLMRTRSNSDYMENMWMAFASKYKDTAIALLRVYSGRGPDSELPEAFGNDIYELRAASKIFGWASYDLERDDMNRRFKCEIAGLRSKANMLKMQLQGNKVYFNDALACEDARAFARQVITNANHYQCQGKTGVYDNFSTISGSTGAY